MGKRRGRVKCVGRFPELRDYLYNDALPIVLGDNTMIDLPQLSDLWGLIGGDVSGFDFKDPYYNSQTDTLRRHPETFNDGLSLVPLIESPEYHMSDLGVYHYVRQMGNLDTIAHKLAEMSQHPKQFFRAILKKEPRDVRFPGGENLSGYSISGNVGIGTLSEGGIQGSGVRSDSPFLLEVYKNEKGGERNLAAVVGFWAQDNEMLVSQMQSCRNARFPEDVPFGVGCLAVAEAAARKMGFKKILAYNARCHPIFSAHPENWGQFGADFVALWDNSAKKLGYEGSRNCHYEKDLGNGSSEKQLNLLDS